MVQAEFDQDYHAALELPSTATPNDIKKQFKKLALQYHPDRNPDKDTTAKF
ncbi:hypothetical protein ABVK25_011490 [Lepraria finkii]|uniref:J domain-containing protein n=1 Tax=Lepraria finkii TaxID=1340010 RepID=A0ABR4AQQ3_9LECA